jgi:AraC-like DNA-binding protein
MPETSSIAASDPARIMEAFVGRWQTLVLSAGERDAAALLSDAGGIITALPDTVTLADRAIAERILLELIVRLARRAVSARQATVNRCVMDFVAQSRTSAVWKASTLELLHRCAAAFAATDTLVAPHMPLIVHRVLAAIHDRYADPSLRLSSLARESDVSPCHLSRLLMAHTGKTFLEHLHDRRAQAANARLTTSPLNVQQTAIEVGYSNAAQLRRHYVRRYAMTPMAVRKQSRES